MASAAGRRAWCSIRADAGTGGDTRRPTITPAMVHRSARSRRCWTGWAKDDPKNDATEVQVSLGQWPRVSRLGLQSLSVRSLLWASALTAQVLTGQTLAP